MEEILVDSQRRGESLQSSRIRVQDNRAKVWLKFTSVTSFLKCDNSLSVTAKMAFKVNFDLILLVLLLSGKTDFFLKILSKILKKMGEFFRENQNGQIVKREE